ncbi:MAG: 6,7-dimethyl-8-ribityllumazine synthase [Vicinamibacterales bacterium]
MPTFEGAQDARGLKFAVVVARFNDFVTTRLLAGARQALADAGVSADDVDVVWVPGAFEVPAAAKAVARLRPPAAVVCLACVIRGGTPHFEYISSATAHGLMTAALDTGVPMTFGILTTDSVEQAVERAGADRSNKGYEAAQAAVELATLVRRLGAAS